MPPPIRWDRTVTVTTPTVDTDPATGNPREVWPGQGQTVQALRGAPATALEDATDGQTTAEEVWAFNPVDVDGDPAVITSRSQVRDDVALYRIAGNPVAARSYLTRRPSHTEARLLFISDLQESP